MDISYSLVQIESTNNPPHRSEVQFAAIYALNTCKRVRQKFTCNLIHVSWFFASILQALEEQFPRDSGYKIAESHLFKFKAGRDAEGSPDSPVRFKVGKSTELINHYVNFNITATVVWLQAATISELCRHSSEVQGYRTYYYDRCFISILQFRDAIAHDSVPVRFKAGRDKECIRFQDPNLEQCSIALDPNPAEVWSWLHV